MALTPVHRQLVRSMVEHNMLTRGGALLQLGEADWTGTLDPTELRSAIDTFVADPARRADLTQRVADLGECAADRVRFEAGKIFYDVLFSPCDMQIIDSGGGPGTQRLDLNHPIVLDRRFDVVVYHVSADPVFDVAQLFRTIHDFTVAGGLMIHESPFTGRIDHGFYSLQPTLFADVAEFNQYLIRGMFIGDIDSDTVIQITSRDDVYGLVEAKRIPTNTTLFAVMNKGPDDQPFRDPIQGYYRASLSDRGMKAWHKLR